ncbi:YihA family ribosome biogenesis GTP-binding protein [Lentilactobacillus parafarraginis]|jgi:GTP-binding protein|uniref:Probable GTP-binding protein EngB n=2 Tax=Lentilactobacillus parafarraginis TaxID=390842 RepID=A0A0R1YYI9_9LACO|nr:ribosome biogenesis GTP-binding protein YihA/YsxC [Lentilactobacillus parafarraginis]KRM44457.1 ribosome biogenesis GTP-binding protein YsxC [Lentilactobacillus parafarraginis DSM 18390 = JCM 14109]TLQ15806.1 YihA family ribosome biogenesis GTP-binding protein [Lentilactobacillus parafarraginis]
MDVHNVDLTISAVDPKQYPNTQFPEIAFVGRSNVGKSSLTNVLINRNGYARTSSQPGKTQTLNFYNIEDKLFFVDVPGYGYAKASKVSREKWGKMIETYLTSREQLRGVVALVDGRHAPTADDVSMHEWLTYYGIEVLTVATKMDKIAKGKWNKQESIIRKTLNLDASERLILFSSLTKQGKAEVWQWIEGRMHQ